MKTMLKISVILNLALLAGLLFIVGRQDQRRQAAAAPLVAKVTTEMSAPPAPVSAPPSGQQTEPPPFRWSQLEAKDYHDYVKNLRAVGCPEATVRAIVAADVNAVYSFRAREIEQQLSGLDNCSWTNQFVAFKKEAALKDELLAMPDAEAAEVADLLGLKPAPVQVAAAAPAAAGESTVPSSRRNQQSQQQQQIRPASQPLVLQDMDLSALDLTEEQKQAIADVRQDFLQQIGGANQDPNDPAYLARWQKAQPAADNMLQAYLGNDAYAKYQFMAYQKSLENQAGQQ